MTAGNPVVSLILTFFQHRAFIGEAVRSVLDQDFDGLEVIVVDDGSTDGGGDVVRGIADRRVTLITQRNGGPSLAANAGIRAARGEYVGLLGGDDIALPGRIARQHDYLSKGHADIVFDVPQVIDEAGRPLADWIYPTFAQVNSAQKARVSLEYLFFHGNFLCAPSVFMRRSTFQTVGLFAPALIQLQDHDFWIRCLKAGLRLRVEDDRLTAYRRRVDRGNLSNDQHMQRVMIEDHYIMRRFFDGMTLSHLRAGFPDQVPYHFTECPTDLALAKALIYLQHPRRDIAAMGFELIMDTVRDDPDQLARAASVGLTMPVVFNEMLRLR